MRKVDHEDEMKFLLLEREEKHLVKNKDYYALSFHELLGLRCS